MSRRRTLTLARETLAELAPGDLRSVAGAAPTSVGTGRTCVQTHQGCTTGCPPPDTEACSNGCSLALGICLTPPV